MAEERLRELSDLAKGNSPYELGESRHSSDSIQLSLVSLVAQPLQALSPFASTCVVVNYISIGYLFLPWAFAQAGTVLSCLGLAVVALQAHITSIYVLEACARAEALARWSKTPEGQLSERRLDIPDRDGSSLEIRDFDVNGEPIIPNHNESSLAVLGMLADSGDGGGDGHSAKPTTTQPSAPEQPERSMVQVFQKMRLDLSTMDVAASENANNAHSSDDGFALTEDGIATRPRALINHRRFEISELCRIFLGERWRALFVFTTACDLYGITWSFVIVSASSLQENLPILDGDIGYKLYALIFASVVVPLSCVDIVDQLFIQMSFLFGRMLMVLVMLVTVAIANGVNDDGPPHFDQQIGPVKDVPTFDFRELYIMMQVAIFSTAYQFSAPTMAEISVNKERMGAIFGSACAYIAVTTMSLSLVLATFFGQSAIETSSNLNWAGYHGGTGVFEDGVLVDRAPWARFISGFVVCFPPFDFVAVYPLIATSLGEILMGAWYGAAVHKMHNDWKRRLVFRFIASAPQIVGAVFVKDISLIANYAGLFTVASYSICPALLAIYSRNTLDEVGMFSDTFYQTPFSSNKWAWGVCLCATALVCYVVLSSIFTSP